MRPFSLTVISAFRQEAVPTTPQAYISATMYLSVLITSTFTTAAIDLERKASIQEDGADLELLNLN
jgi:hypothetical protein